MNQHREIREDLEPRSGQDLARLGEHLLTHRPLPSPTFRGELGRHLLAAERRAPRPPRRLRALIAGWASAGSLLLAAGALSASGAGPLS